MPTDPPHFAAPRLRALGLSAAHADDLARHARETYPRECVGALVARGERITRVIPLANRSGFPRTRYRISVDDLAAVARTVTGGDELIGIYHSHPDRAAECSVDDRALPPPCTINLIVSVMPRQLSMRAWCIVGDEIVELPIDSA